MNINTDAHTGTLCMYIHTDAHTYRKHTCTAHMRTQTDTNKLITYVTLLTGP